jgi:hypothetical protein
MALQADGGYRVVSSTYGGDVLTWDTRRPEAPLFSLHAHHSAAVFSLLFDDGLLITGSADRQMKIIDYSPR